MAVGSLQIMGILNVTPDSFSDGGRFATFETAMAQAERLIEDGADILDIGGESSRPYATPVPLEEELRRTIPVIDAVRKISAIPISIDTTKAQVARAALDAGANIINDISALRYDPEMLAVVQATTVPVILMHMQGTPADMQIKPAYEDVVGEVKAFLQERLIWLAGRGVDRDRLYIDPGIGFGKALRHNLALLKHLEEFAPLGVKVLLGHSRKRFLGEITAIQEEESRDLATAVISALCAAKQVSIIRVHNVAATRQALLVAAALQQAD